MAGKKWYQLSLGAQDQAVYLLIILICTAIYFRPIGIALVISDETREFKAYLDAVPEGGVILYNEGNLVHNYVKGFGVQIYQYMFELVRENNIKLILVSTASGGPLGGEMIEAVLRKGKVDITGTTYGEDYVNLGWLPGFEMVLAAIANNIQTVTEEDAYGTPISDIPLMQGLTNDDIDLLAFSASTSVDPWMRQWGDLGKPLLMVANEAAVVTAMGYIEAGVLDGYLYGGRGQSEFESIIGWYTLQTSILDTSNVMTLYGIALILITNISYWMKERRK